MPAPPYPFFRGAHIALQGLLENLCCTYLFFWVFLLFIILFLPP